MLICANGMRTASGPNRMFSGVTSVAGAHRFEGFKLSGAAYNIYGSVDDKSGKPDGNRPPVTWLLPRTAGGMASRYEVNGASAVTASGAMGVNGEAGLSGDGLITNAPLQLVVSAIAAITGAGQIDTAGLAGKLEAVAALSGDGDLTAAIGALAGIFADLDGDGALTGALRALGFMEAAVTPFTELSPQSLAAAVWATIIESGLTAEDAMKLIAAATAGKVSGAEGSTVTIRSAVADDKSRIVATVDGDGNRTAIVYDLSE
jgi:hypothetical protein